jgi:hypothetical protein
VEQTPRYDSFVMRIWHEAITGRLLRAEIDHVQTGAVYLGRDVLSDWILETLRNAMLQSGNHQTATTPSDFPNEESEDA